MSTASSSARSVPVTLTRAEKWVIHSVLIAELDRLLDRDQLPQWWIPQLIEKVEADVAEVTQFEAWGARLLLSGYEESNDLPAAERTLVVDLVERLDMTFGEPPSTLILDE